MFSVPGPLQLASASCPPRPHGTRIRKIEIHSHNSAPRLFIRHCDVARKVLRLKQSGHLETFTGLHAKHVNWSGVCTDPPLASE